MSKETRSTIRESWLKKAGTPSKFGIALNITTTTDKKFKLNDYQIRGVVDVLSGPQNDDERMALARILLSHADIPDRSKRRFQLIAWERIEGGEGVKVQQCREFPIITTKDIIPGSFQKFEAPAYEEPRQEELPGDLEHTSWQREYQANPYCRFESRKELHQRWQDINVNMQTLTPSGHLTLSRDYRWHSLSQHVLDELFMRGQPMTATNMHPRIDPATPFKDKRLCNKAAEVVAAQGSDNNVFVKYGQLDHMKDLYEKGIVWINPVSELDKLTLNQAVRDDERTLVFKGGIRPIKNSWGAVARRDFYTKQEAPMILGDLLLGARFSLSECSMLQYSNPINVWNCK